MTRPSNTLPPVEEEKTKGRTWNGFVCPGCRTVFRVAADFAGTDVMCPSCKETLRLPKTSEEARASQTAPETTPIPESAASSAPVQHVLPDPQTQAVERSILRTMLATHDGRLKLSLALLIPLALVFGALALFPSKESTSGKVGQKETPPVRQEITAPEKPAPPPPPVAVSEMPVPPPPSLPEVEKAPVPEVAVVQPVPEPEAAIPEPAPEVSQSQPAQVAAVNDPDDGLVEAIPATSAPEPPPAVVAQPEPIPAAQATPAQPAERFHIVAKGDTLGRIARKYGVEARAIMQANRMKNDIVQLGRKIVIPPARP